MIERNTARGGAKPSQGDVMEGLISQFALIAYGCNTVPVAPCPTVTPAPPELVTYRQDSKVMHSPILSAL